MNTTTSTQTIKSEVPLYIQYMVSEGTFPTKTMIYNKIVEKQKREPYAFGKSKIDSTYGSLRSMIADVCSNKVDRALKNVYSFHSDGVDYFYTDINDIFKMALECSGIEKNSNRQENFRKHSTIQYQLVKLFLESGYQVFVPNNDLNGNSNKSKYGKTIGESFANNPNLIKLDTSHKCYWIDVVVFENEKPILLIEIEESTQVLKGLERMMDVKRTYKQAKCFVTSTRKEYKQTFEKYTSDSGTYKDLESKFLEPNLIQKLYDLHNEIDFEKLTISERQKHLKEKFNF